MNSTANKKGNSLSGAVNWFVYHMFVVPKTQTRIFDLGYQFYTFELFHMNVINRFTHFIGIPLNLIALYCIFLPNTTGAVIALTVVGAHHLIMALKYRQYAFIPVLAAFHALFFIMATQVFEPYLFNGSTWYQSPVFHFFFWPFLQYVTHSIEKMLPRPWSLKGNWMVLMDYFKKAPFYKVVIMVSFFPFHTIVELVSSWRNLYLELLLCAHKLGYSPRWLQVAKEWVNNEMKSEDPIIDYEDYKKSFTSVMETERQFGQASVVPAN